MKPVLFSIVFVFLGTLYQETEQKNETEAEVKARDDEELSADRESEYFCRKLKSCNPGGPKVCGFDEYQPWLAEFEDICILYKTNCHHLGRFVLVDQVVCDTRLKYDKEHANETFEVIHVRPTTTYHPVLKSGGAATRKRPQVKLYLQLFAAYNCHIENITMPGGGWVCGVNLDGTHASFFDARHLHGVNCQKQGVYWQISTAICQPKIHFPELKTFYYGQPITQYLMAKVTPTLSTTPSTTMSTTTELTTPSPLPPIPLERLHKIPPTAMKNISRTDKEEENTSIFTKIKDAIGIFANFSVHY